MSVSNRTPSVTNRRTFLQGVFLAAGLFLAGSVQAATLTVDSVTGAAPGASAVAVAVSLANGTGEQVSGIQVDIEFDPDVLGVHTVSLGDSAAEASKEVSSSALSSGVVRVIVAGLNQNAIADGPVAVVAFSVANTAASGTYPVTLTGAELRSPYGVEVAVTTVDGSIGVSGSGEGEGEGEGEPSCTGCLGAVVNARPPLDRTGTGTDAVVLTLAATVLLIGRNKCDRKNRHIET